jgi:hypothetical protein
VLKRLAYPLVFIVLAAFFVWVVTNMAENSAGVFRLEKLAIGIGVMVFGSAVVYLLLGLLERD